MIGCKRGFALIITLIMIVASVQVAWAEDDLPSVISEAVTLYEDGEFENSIEKLEKYLDSNPGSQFTSISKLLLGRNEFALGHYTKALRNAQEVLTQYPGSPLVPQVYYLLATIYQARGDSYEAARALVNCLDSGAVGEVSLQAEEKLHELAGGAVLYRLETLREIARSDASRLALSMLRPPVSESPRIGVVVGGSKQDSVGKEIVEGIKTAISIYNQDNDTLAELILKDDVNDEIESIVATRELIQESGAWGIIGYGSESEAVAVAAEAQAEGYPTLLPGYRKPGVYAIGPSVFQVEADWYREGQIAASYAVDSLNLKSFAVIAPATERGNENVSGFVDIVENSDSTELVALEWYFPDEGVSLSRQFLRIRDIAFRRAFKDTLLQVLPDSVELDSAMFEEFWRAHQDSIRISPEYKSGSIDSNDIELSTIDAFYFPIESGTIPLFAPQFAFYSFRTQRFGNSAWYEPEELYRHRQYVEDMVFTAPYLLHSDEEEYKQMAVALNDSFKVAPTRWHIRGYDAARLLLDPVKDGFRGPFETGDYLRKIREARLASGYQYFHDNYNNGQNMQLLNIIEGEVVVEDQSRRQLQLIKMIPEVFPGE